jgi:hypothetical protein
MKKTLSSPLVSAANNIVSLGSKSNSLTRFQSNFGGFNRFLEVQKSSLEKSKLPDKKKIRALASLNIVNNFGRPGNLLGSLFSGALDLGGFVGNMFPGKGKFGKPQRPSNAKPPKPTISGPRLKLGGMRAVGVGNALFAGLDFATGLAEGESVGKAAAGAGGALAGGLLGGVIGQTLIPIPGLGFVIGNAIGGSIGGWAGDRVYEGGSSLKQKLGERLKAQEEKQKALTGGSGSFSETISKFDAAVSKFDSGVAMGLFGSMEQIYIEQSEEVQNERTTGEGDPGEGDPGGGDVDDPGGDPSSPGDVVRPGRGGGGSPGGLQPGGGGGRRQPGGGGPGAGGGPFAFLGGSQDPGQPGVDFTLKGTQNRAVLPGTVVEIKRQYNPNVTGGDGRQGAGYGNYLVIRSTNPVDKSQVDTLYAHFPKGGIKVKEGDKVSVGQDLGRMATEADFANPATRKEVGSGTGPHTSLDFFQPGSNKAAPGARNLGDYILKELGKGDKGAIKPQTQPQPASKPAPKPAPKPAGSRPPGGGAKPKPVSKPAPKPVKSASAVVKPAAPSIASAVVAAPMKSQVQPQNIQYYTAYNQPQSSMTIMPIMMGGGSGGGKQKPVFIPVGGGGGGGTMIMPGPTEGQVVNSLMQTMLLTNLSAA